MSAPSRRRAVAWIGLLVVALLWGLETQPLPGEAPRGSVHYGKDHRTALRLHGATIGELRRAPFRGRADRILDVRIARVTYPNDIIELRRLGFLVPLVPYRPALILAVVLVCAALLSPLAEAFRRVATSLLLALDGLLLLAVGLYGAAFGPGPALRHIERASVGGIVLLPVYFACWLTFVLAIVAGALVLEGVLSQARRRWVAIVAVCAHASLFVSVPALLLPAIETRTGYRVERLGWLIYTAGFLAIIALATWLLTRSSRAAPPTER